MMGAHHAVSGAAAWVAITSTVPHALGWHPMPVASVVVGAAVTAGAALLPDADHHNGTIAHSAGALSQAAATTVEHMSGGHRHGLHSILAVAALTFGAVEAGRWYRVVPVLGLIPAGSALLFVALIAFMVKALHLTRGGIVALWSTAAVAGLVVLVWSPTILGLLPSAVALGAIVHLVGDMLTTGGVPLLWLWRPLPPRGIADSPVLSSIWKPNGYLALPVLGDTGSVREIVLFGALSAYTLYVLSATTGLLTVAGLCDRPNRHRGAPMATTRSPRALAVTASRSCARASSRASTRSVRSAGSPQISRATSSWTPSPRRPRESRRKGSLSPSCPGPARTVSRPWRTMSRKPLGTSSPSRLPGDGRGAGCHQSPVPFSGLLNVAA